MGDVVATVKIMPDDVDVDLEKVKAEIEKSLPEGTELHKIEDEPIAFGLVALKVMFVVTDGEGGTEEAEQKLAGIDGVKTVEVLDVRRLI
ncbi:elongation factor 1-beta [Methanobrevibacter filiformis]|uniref:Elongation factor 1-beta n=1 Tax=Methanobrevibacter filiformis TaxID=55758 RepID=A0A165YZP7_9EURY|nr:elongation factor 1-beta [Methanobrevibacter filiformis]KZX10068.1 elongation factor 1-beta [Methanobrevibacter filiformis]